jgi:hypothetical protein
MLLVYIHLHEYWLLQPPMIVFRPTCRSVNVMAIFNSAPRRDVFTRSLKYREPISINWKHNIKIRMDSIDHYARQWVKCEECEVADTN